MTDKNTGSQIGYPQIVSFAKSDVNGDGIPDFVYLTGIQAPDGNYIRNITLVIQDGRTGHFIRSSLKENSGYDPTIQLVDFTGDGIADIMISIFSGGSGGTMFHYIYSCRSNHLRLLFDFDVYNSEYQYKVTYLDNYKVKVISEANDQTYIIDISQRDTDYLNEIYEKNGKLKNPIEGFVNPLSGLYPVDFDYNGVYELLAYQKIAGRYNADSLGYIQNTLRWKNNRFVLDNQSAAI